MADQNKQKPLKKRPDYRKLEENKHVKRRTLEAAAKCGRDINSLAEELGIDRTSLQRGLLSKNYRRLPDVAEILGVDIRWLQEGGKKPWEIITSTNYSEKIDPNYDPNKDTLSKIREEIGNNLIEITYEDNADKLTMSYDEIVEKTREYNTKQDIAEDAAQFMRAHTKMRTDFRDMKLAMDRNAKTYFEDITHFKTTIKTLQDMLIVSNTRFLDLVDVCKENEVPVSNSVVDKMKAMLDEIKEMVV